MDMAVNYTEEQLKVIQTRNRNLLVSAAAGSGKTAVLVERIIQMVTNNEQPIDIDQLLVVTFTNAAATEMRERISDAIEKKLQADPSQKRLHKQLILLPNANIMTIHAFCLKIIKNHFNTISLDPSFRIGDENELLLLKNDVLKVLLEEKYEEGDSRFLDFIESFSGSKTDDKIETLILDLHKFAMSNPWPTNWIDECIEKLDFKDEEAFYHSEYYKNFISLTKNVVNNMLDNLQEARVLAGQENGPAHYLETIGQYLNQAGAIQIVAEKGYSEFKNAIESFQTFKLAPKRTGYDPELKERAKALIDSAKEKLGDLKKEYFRFTIEEVLSDIKGTYEMVEVLGDLTKTFIKYYQEAKEEKNIIDFNDIEHYALDILIQKNDEGNIVPTEVAKSYQQIFYEILIDEYQDSNLVQETILNAVSKVTLNQPNIFMVGDVKQSIYKFRLAKPELFMEKYENYTEEESAFQRINLHKNFRSREQVVYMINYIFKQMMSKNIGDVTYDEGAALYVGADFEPVSNDTSNTEIMIIHQSDEEIEAEEDITQKGLEARAIGLKIQELVNEQEELKVFDKQINAYRSVKYSDIVVLLRTTSGWSDILLETFKGMNIPAYSDTTTGYFETLEIQTMMNLLRIIDNPRQDIPLVSVLRSPIVGLKGEDLVKIRTVFQGEMFEALRYYIEGCIEEDELGLKLQKFMSHLDYFRKVSKYMPMDELLQCIFEKTNYDYYTSLMPNGVQRKANLDLFIDKAVAYEKTSYRGVFDFIRYVENIHKYDVDTGGASIYSDKDNLVRIMSIHKSKGLEFPIVIVAALGKPFNKQDLKQAIVYHQELGIGADYVNVQDRYRVTTLPKIIIKEQINKELLSEELRILYVALTRAKEKLILVGSVKNIETKGGKWLENLYHQDVMMKQQYLLGCSCFLDWMMGAIIRHPDGRMLRERFDSATNPPIHFYDEPSHLRVNLISEEQLLYQSREVTKSREATLLNLLNEWKVEVFENQNLDIKTSISEKLKWQYNYEALVESKVQLSVTEIKKMHFQQEEDYYEQRSQKPKFIEEEEALTAAERGTAYHTVMCYLDLRLEPNEEIIKGFLDTLKVRNIITDKELKSIHVNSVIQFLKSDLCKRMLKSYESLKRETPFVLGVSANEIYRDLTDQADDVVMIQGVIDVFFEEEGEVVLVDYKTDYVIEGQEEQLVKRYEEQMKYYKQAIEQIFNKKVKEIFLYALNVSKAIKVPC